MKIHVVGHCDAAKVVKGYLEYAGIQVSDHFPTFTIHLDQRDTAYVIVDGVDSELERNVINCIAELLEQHRIEKPVALHRSGGIQTDREIRVVAPEEEREAAAVELGVFRGILRTLGRKGAQPWWKKFLGGQ